MYLSVMAFPQRRLSIMIKYSHMGNTLCISTLCIWSIIVKCGFVSLRHVKLYKRVQKN